MGHHRAPLRYRDLIKPQMLSILKWSISKYFLKAFVKMAQISSKNYKSFGIFRPEKKEICSSSNGEYFEEYAFVNLIMKSKMTMQHSKFFPVQTPEKSYTMLIQL